MKQPINAGIHRAIDFLAVLLLLVAGPLFNLAEKPREIAAMLAGSVLVYSIFTWYVRLVSPRAHLVIDAIAGIGLIFSPWIFGFHDDRTSFHTMIGIGAAFLIVVFLSDFSTTEKQARHN